MAKGPGKSSVNYLKKGKLRLAPGKQNLRAAFLKDKVEFKFFSSPEQALLKCNYLMARPTSDFLLVQYIPAY